jgi:lipopolysaccharide biosynthesis glycosyltransferase
MAQQSFHVVFAVDDNYASAAAVVAHSIRAGLRDDTWTPFFHVIDSGLSAAGRDQITDALGRAGDVEICTLPDRLALAVPRKHWTAATLHRLHIADVISEDIDRVIYLDVDTLVLDDLSELYTYDLGGNPIGAVINEVAPARLLTLTEDGASLSQTGALPPGYFNAGVLLIDMQQWRSERATERAVEIFRTRGEHIPTLDQDILNYLFAERWTVLPAKWNKLIEHPVHGRFGNGRLDYLTRREGIVHFIGGDKPWGEVFPDNALRRLYREYAGQLV